MQLNPVGSVTARDMPLRARARFWSRVTVPTDPDECWLWTGNLSHNGYGRFSFVNGKTHKIRAHRAAWELMNDETIPAGDTIDHRCGNLLCCNPRHMEIAGHGENVRRRFVDAADRRRQERTADAVNTVLKLCAEWPGDPLACQVTAILNGATDGVD